MSDLPQHDVLAALAGSRDRLTRFMMCYRFAIQVVETKISILQQEFQQAHRYNPIEHVTSRLKRPEAVIAKARRRGIAPDEEAIRAGILDIAGVRVVCSFGGDVYRMQQTLCAQADVEVLELKDYVARPKPSGYRSLHAIISVPVYLSDETVRVPVEVQFRTISQDFWASLEHKIFYKYEHEIPVTSWPSSRRRRPAPTCSTSRWNASPWRSRRCAARPTSPVRSVRRRPGRSWTCWRCGGPSTRTGQAETGTAARTSPLAREPAGWSWERGRTVFCLVSRSVGGPCLSEVWR